jgi:hypothetical protein
MDILKNKPVVLGAAAIGVVAIGGYFYAAGAGVEKFEDFLYDNDLREVIRYRDASYSPLSDTITLKDVDLELAVFGSGRGNATSGGLNPFALASAARDKPVITGNLASLSLKGVSKKDALEVRFTGYELVTDPDRSDIDGNFLYQTLAGILPELKRLGVDQTRLDGGFSYRYDKDDDTLELGVMLGGQQLADVAVSLELGRARRLVQTKLPELAMDAFMNPGALLNDFGRIEFVRLDADIDDHGVLEKLAYLNALASFKYDKALNDGLDLDAVAFSQQDDSLDREMQGVLDDGAIETLKRFQAKGGSLRFSADAKRPVRLSDLIKDNKPHRDIAIKVKS